MTTDIKREFNPVKNKLVEGVAAVGGWLLSGSPVMAEAMAPSFDWIAIDLEHGPAGIRETEDCIRAIAAGGAEPFVRVGRTSQIGICLDLGATGIIIPNAVSAEDARAAVRACYFPPFGGRSFSLGRCTRYGRDADKYFANANNKTLVAVMIENESAARATKEIISLPGVDAALVGPYDLSGSLGCPGDFRNAAFTEHMEHIALTCESVEMPYGLHDPNATPATLSYYIKNGMTFLAAGMDTTSVIKASEELKQGREATNGE